MAKSYDNFAKFVKEHRGMSADHILKEYRAEQHSIGSKGIAKQTGLDSRRDITGTGKSVVKYEAGKQGGRPGGIHYMTPEDLKKTDYAIKNYLSNYSYIFSYDIKNDDGTKEKRYLTITKSTKISKTKAKEIAREVLLSQQGDEDKKYNGEEFLISTLHLEFAVENLQ